MGQATERTTSLTQWIRKQRQMLGAKVTKKASRRQDFDGMGNYPTASDYMGPDADYMKPDADYMGPDEGDGV